MGIDRDRRDFTHGTMGRSSFSIRPTKNRSDLSKNSTMDRILFFCRPRVGEIFYWNSPKLFGSFNAFQVCKHT